MWLPDSPSMVTVMGELAPASANALIRTGPGALQRPGLYGGAVQVDGNDAGAPQAAYLFAHQFPGLEFQSHRAGCHLLLRCAHTALRC